MSIFLIIAGLILIVLGVLSSFTDKFNLPILPGDIYISKNNFTIYIPIITSLVASIILTILINIFH